MNRRLKPPRQFKQHLIARCIFVRCHTRTHADLPIIGNQVRRAGVPRHHDSAIPGPRDLRRGILHECPQRFRPLLVEHDADNAGDKTMTVARGAVLESRHEPQRKIMRQVPGDHRTQ